VEIVLPHGNGLGRPAVLKLYADTQSADHRNLFKIHNGKKTVAVYAFVRGSHVFVAIGARYVQAREFGGYRLSGTKFSTTDRQVLVSKPRGSWYQDSYLKVEVDEEKDSDITITIKRSK
jgi:hypothetical protein